MSLQLLNIYKFYKNGKQKQIVLENLSITFDNKGMVGMIGSSGTGKSTILNIIAGIEKANSGSIKINNHELHTASEMLFFRKQYISFIYQYYNMIDALTLKENILLSATCKQHIFPGVEDTLCTYAKKLEVESLLTRYPNELSGGQLQRMALIRAFISDTPILLADEPTGALNQDHSEVVMKELQQYAKNHLVIVVSHDTSLLKKYTTNIIDLDSSQKHYSFKNSIKYELCTPIKSLPTISFYKWKYIYKQLLHHKNRLALIITSQIFTIVTTVMLITAYGGITKYLNQMYYHDPGKNYVEVQKNDYTKPIIKDNEYALLKNNKVERMQYYLDLSLGTLQIKDKQYTNEYMLLPKDKKHIQILNGKLPDTINTIIVNESFTKEYTISINERVEYTFDKQKYTFLITGVIKDTIQSNPMVYFEEALLETKLKEKIQSNTHVVVEVENPKSYIKGLDQKIFYGYSMHLDTKDSYQSLMEIGSFVAIIFIVVSFVISIILIVIILSTMMYERRKDSALLLVYGIKKTELLGLFIKENILIAMIVSILGGIVSYFAIWITNQCHAFRFLTTIDPLFILPGLETFGLITFIYLTTSIVITIFSVTKIFKMNISQLLKEE